MTTSDECTMTMRLCDNQGVVSQEQVEDGRGIHESYLDRHNRLARFGDQARGLEPRAVISEPFACTGSAHLAAEHIRCSSPAHDILYTMAYQRDLSNPRYAQMNIVDVVAEVAKRVLELERQARSPFPTGLFSRT